MYLRILCACENLLLKMDVYIDAAKPSYQEEHGRKHKTPWTDHFVDEVKRGVVACKVFVFFPIYWLVYSQILNNLISQGMLHPSPHFLSETKKKKKNSPFLSLSRSLSKNTFAFLILFFLSPKNKK